MISLIKASAGSGKTYTLSHSYIDLILDDKVDDFAFRHILAVTFTNKAADEMKNRILSDLHKISEDSTDPRSQKAARVLKNLLNDYGNFAVSTIDSFFQQTLRHFARELGQASSYQVELDKDMLTGEAVDNILDSLQNGNPDDSQLIQFIIANMEERISEQKSLNVDCALKDMAVQLKSERFAIASEREGIIPDEAYSTSSLSELKRSCTEYINFFEDEVRRRCHEICLKNEQALLSPSDYYRGWFKCFEKYASSSGIRMKDLSDSVKEKICDRDKWFSTGKAELLDKALCAVGESVDEFYSFWKRSFPVYETAFILKSKVYGLVVANRLFKMFEFVQKERNVVCLDESNSLLKKIIDGSDAPFVYEKTGIWIDHYLLDEFQDTSITQWENFKPLLKESVSRGNSNLIVGDVKQSIYRWRESDWSLLDNRVHDEFPGQVKEKSLQKNFRSFANIIDFNNKFYKYSSSLLDSIVHPNARHRKISQIYEDVIQTAGRENHEYGGYVNVRFCTEKEEELCAVVQTVISLSVDHKVPLGDIAILVRTNGIGTDVSQRLINEGIPVVTEASLRIKNSLSVRRLVSLMSCIDNPDDSINSKILRDAGISLGCVPVSYHSLCTLCEELYSVLLSNPLIAEQCACESVYVTSFMDYVLSFTQRNGDSLREFLKHWEDDDPSISSTQNQSCVKIMTIHKSKGLDFPYVIIPFLEGIELYNSKTKAWCKPEVGNTALETVGNKLFYVNLSKKTLSTCFENDYLEEKYNQSVDAINLMYVATTRPRYGLFLISSPEKDRCANFADILSSFCNGESFSSGEISLVYRNDGQPGHSTGKEYTLDYPVFPIGSRLGIRPYASDFFSSESPSGEQISFTDLSYRSRGVVLHDILSRVTDVFTVEASVNEAVMEGLISADSSAGIVSFLRSRVAAHPEFFPDEASGCKILCEVSLAADDGQIHRPDRVIIRPDSSVLIVDYKFAAQREEHRRQIAIYGDIFKKMGYVRVEALLWYVYSDIYY